MQVNSELTENLVKINIALDNTDLLNYYEGRCDSGIKIVKAEF